MKPYDGGGWAGVSRVDDGAALRRAYEESGTLRHAPAARSSRTTCSSAASASGRRRSSSATTRRRRCTTATRWTTAASPTTSARRSIDMTLTINAFFGWDFNSCEALRQDGIWHPIDFANACPDSQVTSLHYHFPWLVIANLRWSIFCAATKRPMRDQPRLGAVLRDRRTDLPYREKLARLRGDRPPSGFETAAFEEFCATHLAHLDEVAWEFFGTDDAHDAVRQKVAALFPAHEVEEFTELFWDRIQHWRDDARPRATSGARSRR